MRTLTNGYVLVLLLTLPFCVYSQSSGTPHSETNAVATARISGGIVFAGRLWLRGTTARARSGDGSGALISFSLADMSERQDFDTGVLGIEAVGADLWVLRKSPSSNTEWILSVVRGDSVDDRARFVPSDTDKPLALFGDGVAPAVLSQKSIRILSGDGNWELINLQGPLRQGVQMQVASPMTGGAAYMGTNIGEWGGGLQRVDLKTGAVTSVERRDTKELCAGPLNSRCDPVTGVIPDPHNKGCVLASIGLVHFLSHGRILRVCGEQVSVIFEQKRTEQINARSLDVSDSIYGLASANDGFWAVTPKALYHFEANENPPTRHPLPKLEPESGVYMSRDVQGAIVIRTDVNWAVSVSGYTPLVVALDQPKP
jgi:hypothetical protein